LSGRVCFGAKAKAKCVLEKRGNEMDDQDVSYQLRHDSSPKDLPPDGLSHWQLRLVHDFISDYLDTDIGLGELAALTGLSPAHFTKQLKRSVGLPPHQYLIQQRVERAKALLSNDKLNVAEVSQAVGFFDQSHLVRHFKYWVGVTPKDYRERKLKN
jgi:AraC-like DNA-binding protein